MIVPHDKIGRNEPCPCGSGAKYKNCCRGDDTPHLEARDMKTVLYAALLQIAKLTQTACFIIPESVFETAALEKMEFQCQYDPPTKSWRFWVRPPADEPKKVIGPRRIVLPKS